MIIDKIVFWSCDSLRLSFRHRFMLLSPYLCNLTKILSKMMLKKSVTNLIVILTLISCAQEVLSDLDSSLTHEFLLIPKRKVKHTEYGYSCQKNTTKVQKNIPQYTFLILMIKVQKVIQISSIYQKM